MTRHRSTATARSLQTEANAGIHAAGKPAASSRYPNPWGRADRIFKLPELCPKGWLTKTSRCSASVPVNYGFSSKQQLSSGAWAVPKEASKMPSALQQVPGCLTVLGQGLVLPKLQRGPAHTEQPPAAPTQPNYSTGSLGQGGSGTCSLCCTRRQELGSERWTHGAGKAQDNDGPARDVVAGCCCLPWALSAQHTAPCQLCGSTTGSAFCKKEPWATESDWERQGEACRVFWMCLHGPHFGEPGKNLERNSR